MSFNWKHYCYTNKLPSSYTIEDACNHYLNHNPNTISSQESSELKIKDEIFKHDLLNRRNLLFLCHTIPTPDKDSGSNRIIQLLKILINDYGFNVFYLTHDGVEDEPRYHQYLYDIGVKKVFVADKQKERYCNYYIENLCFNEHIVFDTIIFEFYEMYLAYWDKIQYMLPNVKTVVDSVDVHWVRKFSNPNNTPDDYERLNLEKYQEKTVYNSANVVFAVTEQDKEAILKECPGANVKILSNIHPIQTNTNTISNRTKDLIFVGGDGHPPNTTAALEAIRIFKKFILKYSEFNQSKLHIVGKRTSEAILSFKNDPNIVLHDYLSQESLDALYNTVYGALCPMSWGAGIKGKVCEAISNLIPVLTTPSGACGLNLLHEKDAFICDNPDDLIEYIKKLFEITQLEYTEMTDLASQKLDIIAGIESAKIVIGGTLTAKPILVSIVTYNNAYLVQRCIESILLNTKYPNYKILVTSNACSDNTPEIMKEYTSKYSNILYRYNTENKHFIQAHNEAIELFPGYDVVLLNEDIEILSCCWLSRLYSAAYSASYIGCAGGKTIFPNGEICEAGAKLYNDGTGENVGRYKNVDNPLYNTAKYVGYVSGCMMYMRRDCIEKFGAMDMRYYPCYYEDSDWQYNLHINGYKTIYNPNVLAIHREGSACGTDPDDTKSFKRFMRINQVKFLEKYKDYNIESYNQ